MLQRIKTSLCHPRYIGLFFKDKFHKIILLVFVFFLVFTAGVFAKTMLTDQFGNDEAIAVQKVIQYSTDSNGKRPTIDIKYDSSSKKITGNSIVFTQEEVIISFLHDGNIVNKDAISINFTENGYSIYYGYYFLGKGDLNDASLKSFDLSKVQNGDTLECMNFRSSLVTIFDKYQYVEAAIIGAQAIISILVYYALVIVLCLIYAYFANPSIEFKIRMKLVLYDTLPYFYWCLISILLGVSWIQYIACLVPFIYTSITFAHIKRIR
jgi:hypothetical protein